jgi:hypothetical protein
MTESINKFFSYPLWITIPILVSYFILMGDVIYIIWQNRRRKI